MKKLSLLFFFFAVLVLSCTAQKWYPISYKANFTDSVKYAKPIRYMGVLLTPSAVEFNKLHGLATTNVELGYVNGVTSAIQTQLNAKQATLVSGTTLKTVGGISLLGSGDIPTSGTGTVTSVAVTTGNGVSATVTNPTTAATMAFTLGAITPTSVNSIVLTGASTPRLTVTGTSTVSGANTGDNAVNSLYSGLVSNATHTGDVTGSTALTIANGAVTLAKMANMATSSLIYRKTAGTGAPEVNTLATLKTDLGLSGTNTGDQTNITGNAGTATKLSASKTINGIAFDGSANITVPSDIAPGAAGNVMTSAGGGIWYAKTPPDTVDITTIEVTRAELDAKTQIDYFITASNATAKETAIADAVCDGTSDQVQINAALALGYNVRLSSGTFNISAPITYTVSNITIQGAGKEKTTIFLSNGSNCNMIVAGGNYWNIKDLLLDGNLSNNSGTSNGVTVTDMAYMMVDNLEIKNIAYRAVEIRDAANNFTIKNTHIHDCYASLHIYNSDAHATDIGPYEGLIDNCTFKDITFDSQVYVTSTTYYPYCPHDVNVSNCKFLGITGYMGLQANRSNSVNAYGNYFHLDNATGANNPNCIRYSYNCSGGIVDGNNFLGEGLGGDGQAMIDIIGSNNIVISNNYFTHQTGKGYGIDLEAFQDNFNVSNINITGNIFYNISNATEGYGIDLYAATTYTLSRINITGNNFYDDRGASAWMRCALLIGGSVAGTISDINFSSNIMEGMLSEGILLIGASERLTLDNNQFIDIPTGISSTIAGDLTIKGNRFTTVTTPISISNANVTRTEITGNNWYGCTNEPVTTLALGTVWGSNIIRDGSQDSHYGAITSGIVTVKKTLGVYGATGVDFNFASAANMTRQDINLGYMIPAYARTMAIEVICTETVVSSGGAVTTLLRTGNTGGGQQYMADIACQTIANVVDITNPTYLFAVPMYTSHDRVYISGTPSQNWSTLTAGKWDIYITYIQYQ